MIAGYEKFNLEQVINYMRPREGKPFKLAAKGGKVSVVWSNDGWYIFSAPSRTWVKETDERFRSVLGGMGRKFKVSEEE
jgi:hypothetical protein